MSDKTPEAPTTRKPDCLTEVRVGNTSLTVNGYFKQDATETAADKMARAITAEAATGALCLKDAS